MDHIHFTEIEGEFLKRVNTIVWCNVASVDPQQRPRSRIMHPIWEGATGWIGTRRESYKSQHLATNPHLSLPCVADLVNPVYVEWMAAWEDDLVEKQRVWNLFKDAPPPVGYDPASMFKTVEN